MKIIANIVLALLAAQACRGAASNAGKAQLLCHRTANEDVPENTLDSLEQAALLGCEVVEIDLRRTLDGRIVLNHDGILERLTDGTGEIATSSYGELELLDAGGWMSPRFSGMRIALFEDAVRMARDHDIRLVLDIKEKGIGVDVLRIVEREGMLHRVQFNGEWDDVKKAYPAAEGTGDGAVWMQPGVTVEQVKQVHQQGKMAIVNFSANDHGMDLAGMKAAVAAGADAINVDYPRLGADAVGRPVEERLRTLILKADKGDSQVRVNAILELSRYRGFPLEEQFARWLEGADSNVSRAAALALVTARPATSSSVFEPALGSSNDDSRVNAAWALGMIKSQSAMLLPLLDDDASKVRQAALLALTRTTGPVSSEVLLPLLADKDAAVRGAAARALARHQPEIAVKVIPQELRKEMAAERIIYDDRVKRGNPQFTQPEIDAVQQSFRCQMEMVRAIASISGADATRELVAQALRPDKDFSEYNGIVAGFQLWDRFASDAADPIDLTPLVEALGSQNTEIADRAQWTLTNAGPAVLPALRKALNSDDPAARARVIHILAWQADKESVHSLRALVIAKGPDAELAAWAIARIESLHPGF